MIARRYSLMLTATSSFAGSAHCESGPCLAAACACRQMLGHSDIQTFVHAHHAVRWHSSRSHQGLLMQNQTSACMPKSAGGSGWGLCMIACMCLCHQCRILQALTCAQVCMPVLCAHRLAAITCAAAAQWKPSKVPQGGWTS